MLREAINDQKKQQLTIFYNGQIAVCDATDLQASAIILLANSEKVDEKLAAAAGCCSPSSFSPRIRDSLQQSTSFKSQPATPGLAMRRSLQRFLQKRKYRNHTAHPYHRLGFQKFL